MKKIREVVSPVGEEVPEGGAAEEVTK